jgi:hypothetical protein
MNIRLDIAVTDIVGETGLRIIAAILAGERDFQKLARLRDPRVAKSEREIATALEGHFQEEQLFIIRENLAHHRFLQERITQTDHCLATRMAALTISRLDSWLGAYCRRLKGRIGAPKAITATARKLALIFYRAVQQGGVVKRLTAEHYEQANRERILKNLRHRAGCFGFELTPKGGVPATA